MPMTSTLLKPVVQSTSLSPRAAIRAAAPVPVQVSQVVEDDADEEEDDGEDAEDDGDHVPLREDECCRRLVM